MAAAPVPPDQQQRLNASTFQRLHPRVYLERFLSENARPDGRSPGGWRDVTVNVGKPRFLLIYMFFRITLPLTGSISTADGSALVRVGDTTIVCGVKAEIAEPELDRSGEGFLGTRTQGHLPNFIVESN